MRHVTSAGNVLLVIPVAVAIIIAAGWPAQAQTPACQDEDAMAQSMVQDVASSVDAIKKESESDFESKYHQKALTNKLTFALNAVNGAITCLDKASGDPTTASRKDADSKLKAKLAGYHDELKAKTEPKAAKELIATFDLPPATPAATASK
ncbi:MAG TPA: hypothetical protein VGZ29_04495 [Terriglobia bacterium]|nr:hypothetical protein [Terriglobia bacterium]